MRRVILICALLTAGCTAAQTAAAVATAGKVRDLTCGGARVVARLSDRVCRASGSMWVVPRSEDERAEDGRSRLLTFPAPDAGVAVDAGE